MRGEDTSLRGGEVGNIAPEGGYYRGERPMFSLGGLGKRDGRGEESETQAEGTTSKNMLEKKERVSKQYQTKIQKKRPQQWLAREKELRQWKPS